VARKLEGASKGRATIHTPILARRTTTMRDRGGASPSTEGRILLRMILPSKRGMLEYASVNVLGRCDNRDSLRHANSVREQVQPPFSLLPPASALSAPPTCFSLPRQRNCSRATFIAGRTSRNYPAAKSAPPTCARARARARACVCVCMCVVRARAFLARHVRVRPTVVETI